MTAVYRHRAGTLYQLVCRDVDPIPFDETKKYAKMLYKLHGILRKDTCVCMRVCV
jgi:hypothetical protein